MMKTGQLFKEIAGIGELRCKIAKGKLVVTTACCDNELFTIGGDTNLPFDAGSATFIEWPNDLEESLADAMAHKKKENRNSAKASK